MKTKSFIAVCIGIIVVLFGALTVDISNAKADILQVQNIVASNAFGVVTKASGMFIYPEVSGTYYARLVNNQQYVWDTSSSTMVANPTYTNTDLELPLNTATRKYYASFPTGLPADFYEIQYCLQAGGGPVVTDTIVLVSWVFWNGTYCSPLINDNAPIFGN